METNERRLYRPERAAERLDCGRTTIYALIASGELESVKIGRSRRIPVEAIDRYIERLTARTRGDGGGRAA